MASTHDVHINPKMAEAPDQPCPVVDPNSLVVTKDFEAFFIIHWEIERGQ